MVWINTHRAESIRAWRDRVLSQGKRSTLTRLTPELRLKALHVVCIEFFGT